MPWYAQKGSASAPIAIQQANSSPGPNWVLIPGTTNSMTRSQAIAQLEQDILHGDFGSSIKQGLSTAAHDIGNAASSVIPGLGTIGDFFSRLTQKATWERVAEFGIGAILLYVGLKATVTPSGEKPVHQTARSTAKNAAKLFASSPAGKARTVRKIAKQRSNKVIQKHRVKERTATNLMRAKRTENRKRAIKQAPRRAIRRVRSR